MLKTSILLLLINVGFIFDSNLGGALQWCDTLMVNTPSFDDYSSSVVDSSSPLNLISCFWRVVNRQLYTKINFCSQETTLSLRKHSNLIF